MLLRQRRQQICQKIHTYGQRTTANISIFRRSQFFHTNQIREQDVLHAERIQKVCVCTVYNVTSA